MKSLLQDLRYGARMLVKNPGFTAVAVIAIALGVGANTAIFSVVNAVLLRPLPYAEPGRLVAVGERDTRKPARVGSISYPNFFDWRAQNQSFENMSVYRGADFTLTGPDAPVHLNGSVVSSELFTLLGARPALGRVFTPEEEKPGGSGASYAAIISHMAWQRRFGADPDLVGRVLTLDGKQFNVVGVMPAGFQFPLQADPVEVWVTLAIDAEKPENAKAMTEQRGAHFLEGIGRLKPNVSLEQAQAEMDSIAGGLEEQYPDTNAYDGVALSPFHLNLVAEYRPALLAMFGAVACVLLIACANVANLLLARATVRHKEIAIRAALGASRWRVVRQLLTESVLLALAGGALGMLLALWGTEALVGLIPEEVPRLSEISIDRWVLGFTLLVSMVTGVVFGLVPAMQASKIDLSEAMKDGGRTTSGRRMRLRNSLVVVEIALALVLLVGAGLLARTFMKLQQVDLGFDARNVLTASVELPDARYPRPRQQSDFFAQLVERVGTLPGVVSASAIQPMPLGGNSIATSFELEGVTYQKGERPGTSVRTVNLDYFRTMKIPFIKGRDFTPRDDTQSQAVAIINESFARLHYPDEDPIGKRVKPGISVGGQPPWREIVGVVKDVKHSSLSRESGAELYLPHAQLPFSSMSLVVRTEGDPRAVAKAVQAEVAALDKDIPLYQVKSLDQYLGNAVAQPRLSAMLFGVFAVVALVLSAVGLYGVMTYSVTQRTHEIGIRMALGAQQSDVLKLVVGKGLALALAGVAIGLAASYFLTRLMSSLLFGVSATDPATFIVISVILTGVALGASFMPARRATKVDPMVALRYE
ncbi:MAG TPA: ABC transporter permease [Blastocatellia bacterium]|nr:ABC transporter permease [Blastocatellia bacterium]